MIKDILNANENAEPNMQELTVLRDNFPSCFTTEGKFDLERFKELLSDKIIFDNDGYELKFLGKNYARLLVTLDTTTVVVPDEKHNLKSENMNSENIYISGDNLDGLKHLKKSYSRCIKMIYIDPPYNTGTDNFVYNDNFNFTVEDLSEKLSISEKHAQHILDLTRRGSASHSAWIMFMYPRLQIARDLLTIDGAIFISVDDNEQANLKLLCDDVFGEENFIAQLIVTVKPEGRRYGYFAKTHEYCLVYSKKAEKLVLNEIEVEGAKFEYFDENGGFNLSGLRNRNVQAFNSSNRPNLRYPFYVDIDNSDENGFCTVTTIPKTEYEKVMPSTVNGIESVWRWGKERSTKLAAELLGYRGNDNEIRIFQKKRKLTQTAKTVLKITEENQYVTLLEDKSIISNKGTKEVQQLIGKGIFDFPKPLQLIKTLISIGTNEDDIILDFFAGSSTTAHAVMDLNANDDGNRKFIMVQLQESVKPNSKAEKAGYATVDEIGIERIKRTDKAILDNDPKLMKQGFKHYTLFEPINETIDKMESFDPYENKFLSSNNIKDTFGSATILTTWLERDGYGLTTNFEELTFSDYKAYYVGRHLYFINPELHDGVIDEVIAKYESDIEFNPENVVLFGYSFTWTEMESLEINLKRLKDMEKSLNINFEIRY